MTLTAVAVTSLASCSDDDDNNTPNGPYVPQACLEKFAQQYPDAKNVKWEIKAPYFVAEFHSNNNLEETESWYKADGTWAMSETDYGADLFMIPTAVNLAFNQTEYAQWPIDDIKYYQYPAGNSDFYLIEVKDTDPKPDMQLYFKPDGTLIKTTPDSGADITPDTVI